MVFIVIFLQIKITIDTKRSTVLISLLLYPSLTLSGISILGKSTFSLFRQSRSVFLQVEIWRTGWPINVLYHTSSNTPGIVLQHELAA
jgi:hypothetical protein